MHTEQDLVVQNKNGIRQARKRHHVKVMANNGTDLVNYFCDFSLPFSDLNAALQYLAEPKQKIVYEGNGATVHVFFFPHFPEKKHFFVKSASDLVFSFH